MDVLIIPEPDEIRDLVRSVTASKAFQENQTMHFSRTIGGARYRVAFIQEGGANVESVRFVITKAAVQLAAKQTR